MFEVAGHDGSQITIRHIEKPMDEQQLWTFVYGVGKDGRRKLFEAHPRSGGVTHAATHPLYDEVQRFASLQALQRNMID